MKRNPSGLGTIRLARGERRSEPTRRRLAELRTTVPLLAAEEISEESWREWIAQHGRSGVLVIDRIELLPPGLQQALEFDSFALFLPDHARPSLAVDQGNHVEVRVNAGLVSEQTVEAGTIERVIRTGGVANHILFGLPKVFWAQGNARRMLEHAVRLYDQLGVQSVDLKAVGLGKYIWATGGFDFQDDASRQTVIQAMSKLAQELELFDGPLPDLVCSWDVLALDFDSAGRKIYVDADRLAEVLADRGEVRLIEGLVPAGRMTPSKALYLYSRYDSWMGTLDLQEGTPSRSCLRLYLEGVV